MAEINDASESRLIEHIRENSGLATTTGVIMLIAGILAMAAPAVAGLSLTIMVGASLAASGVFQSFLAFKADGFGKGLLVLIVGVLMAIAGFYMISQPVAGLASITILLMAYLIATGIMECMIAFQLRPADGWGAELANGVITALLGIMLWMQFPLSGIWAVGILFGVKMMFSGIALIAIGRAAKQATEPT